MPTTSLVIFVVSLILRIWQIAYPINVDEGFWMFRGASFMRRLLEGDFAGTYLRHHPGVTNMWLTGTGHLISSAIHLLFPNILGVEEIPYLHSCFSTYECPISLWIVPRLLQALVTSACMVGIYVYTKKLLGINISLVATVLLLLEPFFLAYQRFLTTDALQADFSILAVLSLLLYLREKEKWQYLVASGIFLGLATASKIPAILIVPGVTIWLILIELGVWRDSFPRLGWHKQLITLGIWGLVGVTVIVLIWPTLWVNPIDTLVRIYEDLLEESARGDLFFMGEVKPPGITFYPLILAYKLSPILQIGVISCLLSLVIPQIKVKYQNELVALIIVTITVLVILSTSDSKIGRYIVVIVPELAILAAAGYLQMWSWLTQVNRRFLRQKPWQNFSSMIFILGLIQATVLTSLNPHYVAYYNPLFGGAVVGQKLIHIGIGEGLDKAANLLNEEPNVESLKVASWYRWAFVPYFKGDAVSGWSNNPLSLLQINRVLIYINQIQRNLPSKEFIDYFLAQNPLDTIAFAGLDYIKIYPGLAPLPEELAAIQQPSDLVFDRKIRLIGYNLNAAKIKLGEPLELTFYWQFLESLPSNWQVSLSLETTQGEQIQTQTFELFNGIIPSSEIPAKTNVRDVQHFAIAEKIKPATYNLKITWIEPEKKHQNHQDSLVIGKVEIAD